MASGFHGLAVEEIYNPGNSNLQTLKPSNSETLKPLNPLTLHV
jgi:hypothetical protein